MESGISCVFLGLPVLAFLYLVAADVRFPAEGLDRRVERSLKVFTLNVAAPPGSGCARGFVGLFFFFFFYRIADFAFVFSPPAVAAPLFLGGFFFF